MDEETGHQTAEILLRGHTAQPKEEFANPEVTHPLGNQDLVNGEPYTITMWLSNVGNVEFLGGVATEIELEVRDGIMSLSRSFGNGEIGQMGPRHGGSFDIDIAPIVKPGLALLTFKIVPQSKQDVEVYNVPPDSGGSPVKSLSYPLRVTSREQVMILSELREIKNILRSKNDG